MNQLHGSNLDFAVLKEKQRSIRDRFPDSVGLRVHRSISWIGRAEREADDLDARFLFYWIAFNAAYAADHDLVAERAAFALFFEKLCDLDKGHRLFDAVWERFAGPIRLFLENRYVFSPFWSHQNGQDGYEDWEARFDASVRTFHGALVARNTPLILALLFDRLYVLRNQIVHGGATWNSSINRDQLRDGSEILSCLVPIMVDIMMEWSGENWGKPFYPLAKE